MTTEPCPPARGDLSGRECPVYFAPAGTPWPADGDAGAAGWTLLGYLDGDGPVYEYTKVEEDS